MSKRIFFNKIREIKKTFNSWGKKKKGGEEGGAVGQKMKGYMSLIWKLWMNKIFRNGPTETKEMEGILSLY